MKETKSNIKFVWQYAKDEKKKFILFAIINIFQIAVSVITPILSAKIIISLTSDEYQQIIYIAIAILLVDILRELLNWSSQKVTFKIHRNVLAKAEIDLGREILKLSNESINKHGTGVFIQRLNNDTGRITDIFGFLLDIFTSIIKDIGIYIAIFIVNKAFFFYILAVSFISFLIEKVRANKRNEEDKKSRKQKEKVSGFVSEIVRGQHDIKLLNSENNFINELDTRITESYKLDYKMRSVGTRYRFFTGLFDDASEFVTILLLVFFISIKRVDAATALILYNYSNNAYGFAFLLGNFMERMKDFNLSCNRVKEIFDGKEFKKEKFGKEKIDNVKGNIEFKDVEFYYKENKPVLKDLNFKIEANKTVAFVGKSGSGKSTIFNLICKIYEPVSGIITLDGKELNTLTKNTIRGNITVISQDPYIFNMTIRDNLKIVKANLKEEDMIKYSKMACFDEFVSTLPDGYDTMIGEGGVNLSGGEKQRLAITRALIQETKIILFDEATSSLDNVTQGKIQEAIDNLKDKYTILIIAHRLSTIINVDNIFLLENGKIKMEGNHKELLNKSPEYKALYEKEIKSKE
jgi:ABC-type multidrug transport system fused ATPase/permease subunit